MREDGAADAGSREEEPTNSQAYSSESTKRGASVASNVHIRVFRAVAWNFLHGRFSPGLSLALEAAAQHTRYGED